MSTYLFVTYSFSVHCKASRPPTLAPSCNPPVDSCRISYWEGLRAKEDSARSQYPDACQGPGGLGCQLTCSKCRFIVQGIEVDAWRPMVINQAKAMKIASPPRLGCNRACRDPDAFYRSEPHGSNVARPGGG